MRNQTQILLRMLEDLAVWAGFATVLVLALAYVLAPAATRPRLRVATGMLLAGAVLTVIGHGFGVQVVRSVGVVAIAIALVRSLLVLLFDLLPFLRGTPKIVRDIIAGLVYFVSFMVVLRGFGVQLDSILTTSALLTAVIGFALQDTLGNLVAGLAMQTERPFAVGDWIQLDGSAAAGKVLEINWRATKVLTLDRVEVIYPNALLAKAALTNYSMPSPVARRNLFVHAHYDLAPDVVSEVLLAATRDCPGVLAEPPPSVVLKNFDPSGVQYWIRFFIDDYARRDIIDSAVWQRIWYAMQRESLEIPYQTQTLYLHEMSEAREEKRRTQSLEHRLAALGRVDFLGAVPPTDLQRLAEKLRVREFTVGETILNQGDAGSSFFLIESGAISVHVAGSDGIAREVATLKTGDFFGEMSLMTGEPRTATCRAGGRVKVLEIDHEMFADVLRHGEIAEQMSTILAQRQVALGDRSTTTGEASSTVERRSEVLLQRIKRFFLL